MGTYSPPSTHYNADNRWDASDVNQYQPVLPLENLPFNQWWFHNYIDKPPAPGKIMNLPAGGTYHGQVACNKAWTTYNPQGTTAEYACDDNKPSSGTGAMHTTDKMGDPNPKDVKGCGLSIAYESDVHKLKPEDFTVISVCHSYITNRVERADDRSHTTALGRRMSISISPRIYPHAPREVVIVLGDGSTRRMEEVLRCINWDIGVMSLELL
jgi:hypothetical protein